MMETLEEHVTIEGSRRLQTVEGGKQYPIRSDPK